MTHSTFHQPLPADTARNAASGHQRDGSQVADGARIHPELAAAGLAVLAISSEVPELLALCDRIAVMSDGTIVAVLEREDATPERLLALALGAAAEARAV